MTKQRRTTWSSLVLGGLVLALALVWGFDAYASTRIDATITGIELDVKHLAIVTPANPPIAAVYRLTLTIVNPGGLSAHIALDSVRVAIDGIEVPLVNVVRQTTVGAGDAGEIWGDLQLTESTLAALRERGPVMMTVTVIGSAWAEWLWRDGTQALAQQLEQAVSFD